MNRDVAVYAGTFDPVTLGHLDLVNRAAALFKRVIVCVSEEGRSTLFTAEERLAFVREAARDLANVEVVPFRGLLVEEARRRGARVLLRGVRGGKDLDAEMPMAVANRSLAPEIETLLLPAATGLALVSSSLVREVTALGGDASAWVPPVVAAALAKRRAAPRSRTS
jgi:pantetheine-phosphate adenylyltransferase